MRKPLLLILPAYIAGILAGSRVQFPQAYVWAGIMGASLAMIAGMTSGRKKTAFIFAPLIFLLFGFLFIGRVLHPDFPAGHIIHFAGEQKYHLEGILCLPPEPLEDKTRLYVRAERIFLGEGSVPVTGKLLLNVKDRQVDLRYGDRVRFVSRLYLPRPATNPGAFDYRRFLALQGIWATAYANSSSEVVRMEEKKGNPFFHFVETGRERIRLFLDQNAPPESRGIIKALVLGERGDIPKEVNERFIVSGVTHILSISGLHIALVAAFFFGVTRFVLSFFPFLLLRLDLNKTSAVAAILPVIFYTFIAGLGVAAIRSAIMVLSFLFVLLLDREKDLYDALGAAAFFILVFNPAALFDVSFQLSFLSVLAMVYFIPRFLDYFSFLKTWPFSSWVEEQPRWKRKVLVYLGGSLLTSTAAMLGTGPLVGYYFNRISLVGFISNLVLVPLMGFVNTLLSLITALCVFFFEPMAKLLTVLNVWILNISLSLVDIFSRFPSASQRVATPTFLELILLYGVLITAANLKRWKRSLYCLVILAVSFIAVQIHGYYAIYGARELTITFLDVGQGDAAVVFFPGGKVMVIDGGGSLDGSFDPGERIVAPYLWKMKRKTIDYLVNSHPHPDHLQGLLFLLENFEVKKVWDNGSEPGDSILAYRFAELVGDRLESLRRGGAEEEINGMKVFPLHPPPGIQRFWGNDGSLALRLSFGEISFLFCGDVESGAESEILQSGANLRSSVIKVPHHGSKSSSTQPFLDAVAPQYAVFTVRPGTRLHLPHPTVLERYEKLGTKIYRTDQNGAITFRTDGKSLRVQTFMGKKQGTLFILFTFHISAGKC